MISVTKQIGLAVAVVGLAGLATGRARADIKTVNSFASSPSPGSWYTYDQQSGGTASIVAAPNGGGTPPTYPGAALLSTISDNNSKIQIGVQDNFGLASQLGLSSFSASYAFYKDTTGGLDTDAAAAPALKLTISDGTNGITFVYEPYYQGANPTPNQWNTANITSTSGEFWTASVQGNGFGLTNQAGGGYGTNQTLGQWITQIQGSSYAAEFAKANLTLVGLGMGTYNPGQMGYIDYLTVGGTGVGTDTGNGILSRTYNFQAVPEPSTLAIAGLGALGFLGYGWRCRVKGS